MLLLVRPAHFAFNPQAAETNTFAKKNTQAASTAARALEEFDAFVAVLRANHIALEIVEDTPEPVKPDAVFPNNWISLHDNTTIALWPMCAPNRRLERRADIVQLLRTKYGYTELADFSAHENDNRFLEGTGSLVVDYAHRVAYAALSPRTDPGLLRTACRRLNYKPVAFRTIPQNGVPVYHTNVLLALHEKLAVICTAVIDKRDRSMVLGMLNETGHTLLELSLAQMNAFAGNMLFVKNEKGVDCCILSEQAYHSLDAQQLQLLESFARPVFSPLAVIEQHGGGSARCMLAEIR